MDVFLGINKFLLFSALAINLGLGLFVFFRNIKVESSRIFSYMLFSNAFWVLSFLFFLTSSSEWVLYSRKITPIGSALIAAYLLYFSIIFPKGELPLLKKILILSPPYLLGIISIFTPWIIKGFVVNTIKYPFLGTVKFGLAYPFYSAYLVLFFCAALFNFVYKFLIVKDKTKLQLFYVVVGIGLSVTFGLIASLFMPIFGFPQLFTVGPLSVLILLAFISYAIIRYKLLGIDDFLSRGFAFIFGTGAIICALYFINIGAYDLILPFCVILAHILLGIFVFLRNPSSKINISFFLITICIAVWTCGVSILWHITDAKFAMIVGKLTFIAAAFLPLLFLIFVKTFPKETKPIPLFQWATIILPIFVFIPLIMSGLVVHSVIPLGGKVLRTYGPAYPVFLVYYLLYTGRFFFELLLKERTSSGISRTQIRYVILGFGIIALVGVTTNLILPFLGVGALAFIGPLASVCLVAVISYAILKHRLMSIEVVMQRSFVYGIVSFLILFVEIFMIGIFGKAFGQSMAGASIVFTALATLIAAILYNPMVLFLQNIADELLFHERYDYRKTLRNLGKNISSIMKFPDLVELIVTTFTEKMHVSEMSILIFNKIRQKYESIPLEIAGEKNSYKKIEIDGNSSIVDFLKASKDILFLDEMEDEILKQQAAWGEGKQKLKELIIVKEEMERFGGALWIPIISKDELSGIIFLGNKLSEDIYTYEDIILFTTLADQLAVALENSRLYEEVLSIKNYTQDVLDSMISGVITVDIRGQVITFNPMAEKITGLAYKDVINRDFKEIFSNKSILRQLLEGTINGKTYKNYESSLLAIGGGLVHVSISSSLLRDSNGKRTGALISLSDLTEVKTLEDKVRQADKIGALGTMAAGMAHEIKNPLSSMKVLSQLLPLKYNDPEFRNKMIEIMPREISRIDRIVESLLGFARATSPRFLKIDLNEVIRSDVDYFKDQAEKSGVAIEQKSSNLPEIEGDPDQLSQAFSNLILNAIQAMPEGGKIYIETRQGKTIEGIIQTIEVEVKDTGHGIPQEGLKKLFDPFYTTKYAGTGLGLTITHSIIDGHRGLIDVKSKVGEGTKFTITLPVKQELV